MKPLFVISLLFCLSSFNANAQKWFWVKEAENDTTKYPLSFGDPSGIAIDKKGNIYEEGIYAGGVFFGTNLLITPYYDVTNTYVAKYSPSGNVLWAAGSAIPNPSSGATGTSVAADTSGNCFLTGDFSGTVSFGSYTLTNSDNGGNIFLVKYDPNGNVLWAKSTVRAINGYSDGANSVATDASGNIYVTGIYQDTLTFEAYMLMGSKGTDTINPFLVKYDPNGNVLWAKSGSPEHWSPGINGGVTTDNAGNAYITGNFTDSITFSPYTLHTKSKVDDEYLVKYDPLGNVVWAVDADDGVNSEAAGEAISSDGNNIYVGGGYHDSLTIGSQTVVGGDLFIAKYNSSGKGLWVKSSYYGGFAYSISASSTGSVYFCGEFQDSIMFGSSLVTSNAYQPSFIYKFDSSGNVLCATSIANDNDDYNGVAADPLADDMYFTGDVYGGTCLFGDTILYGTEEWAFLGKWTCDCKEGTAINNPDTICAGKSARLSASGGKSYTWLPASGLNSTFIPDPVATPSVTTTYTVVITDAACTTIDSVPVVVHPGPVMNVCCDTALQPGGSVQLSASGGVSYNWEPSYGLSCNTCPDPVANPLQNTTYYVTVVTDYGCSAEQTITVDITCGQVFIPEAFSPNGDGQNDVLYVRGDCIETMQFEVFDRWGNRVFKTTDKNIGWDGRYRGEAMNTGSYVYYLKATMYDGTTQAKKGTVTLVR